MDLIKFNKHWEKGFFYDFRIKRIYFEELKKSFQKKFITLLIGLRRVGKTTLLLQLIDELIKNNISRDSILYFSFDKKEELDDVVNNFLKISNKNLSKDKLYFFFDEIQKVGDWQNKIKVYYDLYPNIKIFVSGSSSLFLKSSESLAGRIETFEIKPLFFKEFLKFKKLDYFLEKPLLYKEKLILEFEKYLYRNFFDIIDFNLYEAKKYTLDLKNKIIKQDTKDYFKIKHENILLKIFDIISDNPGMLLDYKNLSNDLGLDIRTIQTYVYYLQESFLIKKIYNFSKNLLTSEKKQKKVYLNSTSFFTGNGEITGGLFENYIQNIFDFKFFYRYVKKEVDFVFVDNSGGLVAIEVKYKSKIKSEDLKGLNFFSKKFDVKRKLIFTKDIYGKIEDVELIPFWELENFIL